MSFAGDLNAGEGTKGLGGGGLNGGKGPGSGPGSGPGFNSAFGRFDLKAPGLTGFFYDMKQDASGRATAYKDDVQAFVNNVLRPHIKSWSTTAWDDRFFKSPEQLSASQIFIPHQSANAAPKAYQVADRVAASRWVAIYRGTVIAPKTGKFRFWGLGDDTLIVRLNNKLLLDAGWTALTGTGSPNSLPVILGQSETKKGNPGMPFRAGPWIPVDQGREYPIEIMISEIPGGSFGAWLMMEEADPDKTGKGDGKIFLFRLSAEPLPEGLNDDTGIGVDMSGKGLIWKAKGAKNIVR